MAGIRRYQQIASQPMSVIRIKFRVLIEDANAVGLKFKHRAMCNQRSGC
jgi:hypothetical protein